MLAIFETGGKQYKVSENTEIFVEKLEGKPKDKITFTNVLLVDGKVGSPFVKGAKVIAEIVKHGKAPKITVIKFKSKKHYRRKQGHRQPYTKIRILTIEA